jgi:hypothetical protein
LADVNPPAGWYVSPKDKSLLQWWDGDSWADVTQAAEKSAVTSAPENYEKIAASLPKPSPEQLVDYVVGGALTAGGAAVAVDGAVNLVKKKTGAGKWFAVSVFLILCSVLLATQAIAGFFGPARAEVAGTVVLVTKDESFADYCIPTAEYVVNGKTKTISPSDSEECRWSVGDEVAVFYDKDTNGRNPMFGKASESWDNLSTAFATFVFGLFFLIFGFIKLGVRAAQTGVGAFMAKKGYDKLKKTSKGQ